MLLLKAIPIKLANPMLIFKRGIGCQNLQVPESMKFRDFSFSFTVVQWWNLSKFSNVQNSIFPILQGEHNSWGSGRKGDAFWYAYCGGYILLLLWTTAWVEICKPSGWSVVLCSNWCHVTCYYHIWKGINITSNGNFVLLLLLNLENFQMAVMKSSW